MTDSWNLGAMGSEALAEGISFSTRKQGKHSRAGGSAGLTRGFREKPTRVQACLLK